MTTCKKAPENNLKIGKGGNFLMNLTNMRKASIKAKSKQWGFDFGKTEMPFEANAERQIKTAANLNKGSSKSDDEDCRCIPEITGQIKNEIQWSQKDQENTDTTQCYSADVSPPKDSSEISRVISELADITNSPTAITGAKLLSKRVYWTAVTGCQISIPPEA